MSLAVRAVQANGRCPAADSRPLPQPDEMPLVGQLGCSRRLGLLAVCDFGLRRSCWNADLELDEELHGPPSFDRCRAVRGRYHVGRSLPACSATMYAAYQVDQSSFWPDRCSRWAA